MTKLYSNPLKQWMQLVLFGWILSGIGLAGISAAAEEAHVAVIRAEIQATVSQLKSTAARLTPSRPPKFLAFWDFDGTLLKGDSSEGLTEGTNKIYVGFMEAGIRDGLSAIYSPNDQGVARFWEDYQYLDTRVGHWLSYPFLPQLFRGSRISDLESLAERIFQRDLRHYYFASSMAIWRECERLGVENHVISAGADFIVQGAAKSLGTKRERIHGIRLLVQEGKVTEELAYPVTYAEGKRKKLEAIVEESSHDDKTGPVFVIAAFGNSYSTDGPFLKYVQQLYLPAGRSTVVMINGGTPPSAYSGLFRCVSQSAIVGASSQP